MPPHPFDKRALCNNEQGRQVRLHGEHSELRSRISAQIEERNDKPIRRSNARRTSQLSI